MSYSYECNKGLFANMCYKFVIAFYFMYANVKYYSHIQYSDKACWSEMSCIIAVKQYVCLECSNHGCFMRHICAKCFDFAFL